MKAAVAFDFIPVAGAPDTTLACWHAYDPASKVEAYSTAIQIGNRLVFVDPIPLEQNALAQLLAPAQPAAIILTNANHARAADEYRRQYSIGVFAHASAVEDLEVTVDELIPAGGGPVLDTLQAVPLPGAVAGEIALYDPSGAGAIIFGDALIHLPGYGFTLLPPKYCTDQRELRRSLAALLAKPFQTMTFAHGGPILRDAQARLAALLQGGEPI